MNAFTTLRSADPARRHPRVAVDERAERELRALLSAAVAEAPTPAAPATGRSSWTFALVAVAAVAMAIVALAVATGFGGSSTPIGGSTTSSPTPRPSVTTVEASGTPWNPALVEAPRSYDVSGPLTGLAGCALPSLTTWAQSDGGGAAGTYYQAFFIQNNGPACLLSSDDMVTVGTDIALPITTKTVTTLDVLPFGAAVRLSVSQTEGGCSGTFSTSQAPLDLRIGSASRSLGADFRLEPIANCGGLDAEISEPAGTDDFALSSYRPADRTLAGLAVTGSLDPDVYLGGATSYTITITNSGTAAYAPATCPSFMQVTMSGTTVTQQRGTLDCRASGPIPAGGSKAFVMKVDAPRADAVSVGWYLIGGRGTLG